MKTLLKYGIVVVLLLMHQHLSAQEPVFGKGIYLRFGAGVASFYHANKREPLVAPLYALPRGKFSTTFEIQAPLGKRLGLLFQFGSVHVRDNVRTTWADALQAEFPGAYITTDFPLLSSNEDYSPFPIRGMIGGAYLLEHQKWSIQLRALIGAFTWYPQTAYAVIKQPDSNALSTLTIAAYTDNYNANQGIANFAGSLGILAHRTIWRRWGVYGKAEWTVCRPSFTFDYVLENQIDGSRTARTYGTGHQRMIHELQAQVGISFQLARFRK